MKKNILLIVSLVLIVVLLVLLSYQMFFKDNDNHSTETNSQTIITTTTIPTTLSAYDSLNGDEQQAFNLILKNIDSLYNHTEVRLESINGFFGSYPTENEFGDKRDVIVAYVRAYNGFGGQITQLYTFKNNGVYEAGGDEEYNYKPDESVMSAKKINLALDEYWKEH